MRTLIAIPLLFLLACRTSGGEKGGLVPVNLSDSALQSAYKPRRLALVIGISEFQDSTWRSLKYSRKDAEDMARSLSDEKLGHFDQVTLAVDPSRTTKASIFAALDAFKKQATRPDDIAVVYISAHGTLARDDKGELRRYLVTEDADVRDVPHTALSIDELKTRFDELPSRRRLLILATCHSGSGKSLLPPEIEKELASIKAGTLERPMEESSRAAMVFSACDWGETAREDDDLRNDIYTHYLVEALSGAGDRNVDGAVTATEAHDYARRRTYAFTQGRQRPSAEILEVGADPVVLSGEVSRTGQPELYSYSARLDGFTLKVDGEPRGDLPGGAAVKPGKRKVELTKGDSILLSETVDVEAGERVDLDALLTRSRPWRSLSLLGGGAGFVDQRSRNEVAPASSGVALALRYDDTPLPRLQLVADLSLGGGKAELHLGGGNPVPFTYTQVTVGAAVPYTWRFGRFTLGLGPRVAALYVGRSFSLEQYQRAQQYLSVSPGVYGGAAFGISERLELSVQTQLMLTYAVVDGVGQAMGFAGGFAGVGYRF